MASVVSGEAAFKTLSEEKIQEEASRRLDGILREELHGYYEVLDIINKEVRAKDASTKLIRVSPERFTFRTSLPGFPEIHMGVFDDGRYEEVPKDPVDFPREAMILARMISPLDVSGNCIPEERRVEFAHLSGQKTKLCGRRLNLDEMYNEIYEEIRGPRKPKEFPDFRSGEYILNDLVRECVRENEMFDNTLKEIKELRKELEDEDNDENDKEETKERIRELLSSLANCSSAQFFLARRIPSCLRLMNIGSRAVVIRIQSDEIGVEKWSSFVGDYKNLGIKYAEFSKDSMSITTLTAAKALEDTPELHITQIENVPYHPWEPDPLEGREYALNIFTGYKAQLVEEVNMELIIPILDHIREILAGGNEEVYEAFLNYLAYGLQSPRERPGVMPILYGERGGEGKGLFVNWLCKHVYGEKISYIGAGVDNIIKRSGCMLGKVFIFLDELASVEIDGGKAWINIFETLKPKITDAKIELRSLYKMPIIMDNYTRWIACTNNSNPVPTKGGHERRSYIAQVSAKRVGDFEYMNRMANLLNQESANHFYTYLCKEYKRVSDAEVRKIPVTEVMKENRLIAQNTAARFMNEVMLGEYDVSNEFADTTEGRGIPTARLYDTYLVWCLENGVEKAQQVSNRFFFKEGLMSHGIKRGERTHKIEGKACKIYVWPQV